MPDLPHDQEARERAINPRESFHLEAPAGSGKTAVLLARFLTLLAGISESPREILTLTFTRKAAGEFRERVMQYFWDKNDPGANPPPHEAAIHELARRAFWHLDQKNLVHQFLQVPERLPISTFHGFCTQLLKAAPMRPASLWSSNSWRMTGTRNGRSRRPQRSCAAG